MNSFIVVCLAWILAPQEGPASLDQANQLGYVTEGFQYVRELFFGLLREIDEIAEEDLEFMGQVIGPTVQSINQDAQAIHAAIGSDFLGPLSRGDLNLAYATRQPGWNSYEQVSVLLGSGFGMIEELHLFRISPFSRPSAGTGVVGTPGLPLAPQMSWDSTSLFLVDYLRSYVYAVRWNGEKHFGFAYEMPQGNLEMLVFYPLGRVAENQDLAEVGQAFRDLLFPGNSAGLSQLGTGHQEPEDPAESSGGEPDCEDGEGLENCLDNAKESARAWKITIKNEMKICLDHAVQDFNDAAGLSGDAAAAAMGMNAARAIQNPKDMAGFHWRGAAIVGGMLFRARALNDQYEKDVRNCKDEAQRATCNAMADSYAQQIHCWGDYCANINAEAMTKAANSQLKTAGCSNRL